MLRFYRLLHTIKHSIRFMLYIDTDIKNLHRHGQMWQAGLSQSVIIQGGVAGEAKRGNTETNSSSEQTKHKTTL